MRGGGYLGRTSKQTCAICILKIPTSEQQVREYPRMVDSIREGHPVSIDGQAEAVIPIAGVNAVLFVPYLQSFQRKPQ